MKLASIVLRTHDIHGLVPFYTALLGTTPDIHRHGNGPLHAAFTPGFVLEIYPDKPGLPYSPASVRIGFDVERLDALLEAVDGKGGSLRMPPRHAPWGYWAVITDPVGHVIDLYEKPPA